MTGGGGGGGGGGVLSRTQAQNNTVYSHYKILGPVLDREVRLLLLLLLLYIIMGLFRT